MNIKLFAKCSTVCCTGVSIKLWIECLGAFFQFAQMCLIIALLSDDVK